MGRLHSKELYELIQSLTKSEKRHFKLRSKQFGSTPEYVNLFDEISKQKSFDEEALIERLKPKGQHKNLAFRKKHLYALILDSLQDFHKNGKVELQILSLFSNIEITYNRGLYSHTEKLIDKGLELSRKHFRFGYELMFTQRKRDLVNHLHNSKIKEDMSSAKVEQIVNDLERDESQLFELLKIDALSSKIYTKSTLVVRFGMFNEIDNLISETSNFRKKYDLETLPFSTQMKIRRSETIVFFAKDDLAAQQPVIMEAVDLFHQHPEMIDEFTQDYLLNINNLLVGKIQLMDFEGCDKYIDILKEFSDPQNKKRSTIEKMRAYAFYQYNQMKFLNTKGEYKNSISSFDAERFERSGLDLNTYKRSQILLELCISHFFLENYRDIIRLYSDVTSTYENFQPEVLSQIRVVYYISHWKRGNIETLEQTLKSKDSRMVGWFNDFEQEKEFLELLIEYAKNKLSAKKMGLFCKEYPVKVNPHFRFYLKEMFANKLSN